MKDDCLIWVEGLVAWGVSVIGGVVGEVDNALFEVDGNKVWTFCNNEDDDELLTGRFLSLISKFKFEKTNYLDTNANYHQSFDFI